jgi:predicted  nucleic acid-binding Zn-ribbon protein
MTPMEKQCLECGATYVARHFNQGTCGPECSTRRTVRLKAEWNKSNARKRAASKQKYLQGHREQVNAASRAYRQQRGSTNHPAQNRGADAIEQWVSLVGDDFDAVGSDELD